MTDAEALLLAATDGASALVDRSAPSFQNCRTPPDRAHHRATFHPAARVRHRAARRDRSQAALGGGAGRAGVDGAEAEAPQGSRRLRI